MSINTKDRNAESRIKMNFKGPSESDDIVAQLVAHANLHSLANVLNTTGLKAEAKKRFDAVFKTDANDDLQRSLFESCVPHCERIIEDKDNTEAMKDYPDFSIGLLHAVGKCLGYQTQKMRSIAGSLGEKLGDIQENNEHRDEQIAIVNDTFDKIYKGLNRMVKHGFAWAGKPIENGGKAALSTSTAQGVVRIPIYDQIGLFANGSRFLSPAQR